jgi:hypothetical protein
VDSRFRGNDVTFDGKARNLVPGIFRSAAHFPLDILPEARYAHLVCLPKNNANVSNCFKEPWTY